MNEKSPPVPQEDHERALNLLVFEYLRKRKYMSSSASFSVEAQVVKAENEIDSQGSFLSDWFQALFKFLQLSKGTQHPPDVEVKKFLESSKHLFDIHKVSSLTGPSNTNSGAPNSGGSAPNSLKTEGYGSKFGNQGRRDSDEPPAKLHAGLANGKPPVSSGAGGAKPPQSSSGATSNGVSVPSMYGQSGNAQIRPQFNLNLSLPSHSAGALANWPGAQGMGSMPPNPMQQGDASVTPQQSMPFLNGHLPNGAGPPNGIPGQNSDPHVMTALQNASPAGLKGSMCNQQFMSPQQLMAQQQSQQQRHILFQQNQRYLLQQQMLAGGIINPNNMAYMGHNAMVAIGNNSVARGMPLYQQREVYAQHHKQVQMLKLQQHNARQQLMLSRQSGAPGQAMGRPAGDTPDHSGAMSNMNFPGNHPGAAQNPMMQQMMNMNAMAGFNGGSSAPHPSMGNNNGHPFNGGNPHMGGSMTPNMGNGGTSTPNSVNFEALFASMQNAGSNMNGGMSHNQPPGASPAGGGTDPLKSSTSEEETSKMYGKFVETDLFSLPDNTGNSNSQGLGGGNGAGGHMGDQSSNIDMYSLDPFAHTEFFS